MRKTVIAVLVILLSFAALFANGTPEEQQMFFDNLMKNTVQNYQAAPSTHVTTSAGSEIISRDMATLERLYQYVDKNFLYDIDYDAVYEAMATALFDTLGDKYSYYVKAEETDDYEEQVTGTYGGLGIYFSKTYLDYQDSDDESTIYCIITQVFPNTPASRAGLKAQDYIIEINGESVIDMEANDCAKLMKGIVGTTVDLTIKRNESIFTLTIKREVIVVPTIKYCMIDDTVGYLVVNEFSTGTDTSIRRALVNMNLDGMQKLIIDLRNCPGGDVDIALNIADMFVTDSELLTVSYKDTTRNVVYRATPNLVVSPEVEVVVLINGGTASSAEILSSALQGSKRAYVIGTTSYGKGIMQIVSSFGTGYTSLTTASFVGPSGETIHQQGVKPDLEVEELTVLDEELDAYTELMNSKKVVAFVDANPEYTAENIAKFSAEFADTGIRSEVLNLVARSEYFSRMITDDIPVVDVVYDNVCKTAYEFILNYENDGAVSGNVVNF